MLGEHLGVCITVARVLGGVVTHRVLGSESSERRIWLLLESWGRPEVRKMATASCV